ncbi:hypothetical protein FTV92_03275 [Escherichia coli]|nr:hypothetical protein FTV92_03275 [Escherichia coli]
MSENELKKAMFIQQRLQILHLGKHYDEFSDSYVYAREADVYPFLQDGDGSIPTRPHEIYEEFFGTSKNKAKKIYDRLCKAWHDREALTFYKLESEYGVTSSSMHGWTRSDLLHICRYLYLEGCFDKDFWETLLENGKCPSEALYLSDEFNRDTEIDF